MNEAKLLNCPFCKEELEIVGKGHYFAHKTNGCILQHLCFEIGDEEAIKAWNTRKPMEKILERLETEDMALFNAINKYQKKMYTDEDALDRVRMLQHKQLSNHKAIEIVKEGGVG